MHHQKTYMYINFQQNRVCRSVITVHTNACIRQKITSFINLQLPIEIFKNRLFQTCVNEKRTCMSTFSKNQLKLCTQICLQKNCKLAFRKITPFGHTLPHNRHPG